MNKETIAIDVNKDPKTKDELERQLDREVQDDLIKILMDEVDSLGTVQPIYKISRIDNTPTGKKNKKLMQSFLKSKYKNHVFK